MTTKEEFQKDKELCKELSAIVSSNSFKRSLAYVRAALFEVEGINTDMMKGAVEYEKLLCDLPVVASDRIKFTDGLDHNIDNPTPAKPENT